jgi:hypothetical protein
MYRIALKGPNAAAYLQCDAPSRPLSMMKRLKNAVCESNDSYQLGCEWVVMLEGRDGEGVWAPVAYYQDKKH